MQEASPDEDAVGVKRPFSHVDESARGALGSGTGTADAGGV